MKNYELNIIPGLTREQVARILAAPVGVQFDINQELPATAKQLELTV